MHWEVYGDPKAAWRQIQSVCLWEGFHPKVAESQSPKVCTKLNMEKLEGNVPSSIREGKYQMYPKLKKETTWMYHFRVDNKAHGEEFKEYEKQTGLKGQQWLVTNLMSITGNLSVAEAPF